MWCWNILEWNSLICHSLYCTWLYAHKHLGLNTSILIFNFQGPTVWFLVYKLVWNWWLRFFNTSTLKESYSFWETVGKHKTTSVREVKSCPRHEFESLQLHPPPLKSPFIFYAFYLPSRNLTQIFTYWII
jgi:hypothetical protein